VAELYLRYEYAIASTQLALAMLGMGATLRLADFADVIRFPKGVLIGLGTQLLLVPLVAFAFGRVFGLAPGLATGLVLVAAVPGGTFSNVLTWFARGHVPLSITLTAVTTVGALVTTPLVLRVLASEHLPAAFEMPTGRIAYEIGLCLLGPLALGMALGNTFPQRREALARWAIRGSVLLIGVIVAGGIAAERVDASAHGSGVFVALFAFAGLVFAFGFGLCGALGLDSSQRMAVGIEAAFRNTSLALMVKASVFPVFPGVADPFGDAVLFVVLLYGGVALPVVLIPLFWHRRETSPAPAGLSPPN
jgi:bile acid:Na+ symporter, BASS family